MPGIVGIVSDGPAEEKRRQLDGMVDLLRHESTYRKAVFVDEDLGLYLGIVSHEGAFDDGMPARNEAGDVVLAFSGETFDDPSVEHGLAGKGHVFRAGDASYLVHLYEEVGDGFYETLNGWFCGVLVDKRRRQAVLFNDRFGMKRLYYSEAGGETRFSSEAKALLFTGQRERSFDERGLVEHIICGTPLEHRTLFKGIGLVPGASRWVIEAGRVTKKSTYFDFSSWESQSTLSLQTFYPELRETFRRILPRYLRPRPALGISLTGGLDTRIIMANAALEPKQVPCYTFNGMYRDCFDTILGRRVAAVCGQEHTTITLDRAFLEDFPRYAKKTIWVSEGTADLSAAADLYGNGMARRFSVARLSGNYGSEVLRKSRFMSRVSRPRMISMPKLEEGMAQTQELLDHLYQQNALTYTLKYEGPWHEYGRYAVESSQLVQRTPFMDNDLLALMYRAPFEATADRAVSIRLVADGNERLAAFPTDRGVSFRPSTPAAVITHGFIEGLFKAEYFVNYGAPQWLAAAEHLVPFFRPGRLILGRHKFYHFRPWFRDELSGFVRETLLDPRALGRPFFDAGELRRMVLTHTSGRGNYTNDIHLALNLELTNTLFLDR